jgi:oxygen-independent coproporphyrinogen-3 oxidase
MEPHPPRDPLSPGSRLGGGGPSAQARAEARTGLYVHIPFCAQRCAYCDFATGALSAAGLERYLTALEREAAAREKQADGLTFTSLFLGGGTPSALSSRHFMRLWKTLESHFSWAPEAEITLEANPETVRPSLLETWARAGVNRLSMGAQSFDALELQRLGRLHGPERPAEAVALARRHGFERLSLDLMYGFPGHRLDSWRRTLDRALALELEHLSAYCFIPEPDSPLGAATLAGRERPLDVEAQADLFQELVERTAEAGYELYETSNFARPGGECRHNLVYWLRRDYLALGPSAHGLWRGVRSANHRDLSAWAEALEAGRACDDREAETPASRADEIVMLGLRLGSGVAADDHAPQAWADVTGRYRGALDRGVQQGRLIPTRAGYQIAAPHRFVADEVIAWLMVGADRDAAGERVGAVPQAALAG